MQDFNPSTLCSSVTSGSLTDRRDNQIYTVAKINGNWWMTRNLAIGCNGNGSTYGSSMSSKTLTSAYSNVSTDWSTPTASLYKNDNTSGCTTSSTSDCQSYTTARMKCDSTYGSWYNYVAATAGTIYGSSNSIDATYDICPASWRLPSNYEQSSITAYKDIFNPQAGGHYGSQGAGADSISLGIWWSATHYSGADRYALFYSTNTNALTSGNAQKRYFGNYVRCVKSS